MAPPRCEGSERPSGQITDSALSADARCTELADRSTTLLSVKAVHRERSVLAHAAHKQMPVDHDDAIVTSARWYCRAAWGGD